MELKKGDVILVEAPPSPKGSEIQKTRPALVVSPKQMAQHAKRVIIVPLTSNITKIYPHETLIQSCTPQPSKACCDQIQTVIIERVIKKFGTINSSEMVQLNQALMNILQLP